MTAGEVRAAINSGQMRWEDQLLLAELYKYVVFAENGKVFQNFEEETIRTILAHRLHKRRLLFHRDDQGEIDGLAAWYRFDPDWDWAKIRNWEEDIEDGGEIVVAFLFADNKKSLRQMCLRFIAREPDCLRVQLSGIRRRGVNRVPRRVLYTPAIMAKILKMN